MRNVLSQVPKAHQPAVSAAIRTVFAQPGQRAAAQTWRAVADNLRQRFAKAAECMDRAGEDVLAFMAFPHDHWPKLASTNCLERLNKENKRRANVVGDLPQRRGRGPAGRRRAAGAERRLAGEPALPEPGEPGDGADTVEPA